MDCVTGEARRRSPVTPVRCERERLGELPHVDVKKVARVPDGGGRRADPAPTRHGPGVGWECLHVAVDERNRVAYAELLGDERGAICAPFARRLASFVAMYVRVERAMTDNGPGCRSRELDTALSGLGVRHLRARPTVPDRCV